MRSATEKNKELNALAPPAPAKNRKLEESHTEISILQHVARVYINHLCDVIRDPVHGNIIWSRYADDAFYVKSSTNNDDIKEFFLSKLESPSDRMK
jgi:hypothetical protein